jgi:hypothetical protein
MVHSVEYHLLGCRVTLRVNDFFIPSSLILSTLIMQAIRFFETSVHTRATLCHIPQDGILRSHRFGNLKSCTALSGWAM